MKRKNGMFTPVVYILLFVLTFAACRKEEVMNMPTNTPVSPVDTTPAAREATFLALGDSYTIGQTVLPAARFPDQTVQMLKEQNIPVHAPVYIATSGWTTESLLSAIEFQNPPNTFDIVTLLIGVNDQYQQRDTAGYATRFEELLNKAVYFAHSRKANVFVLSIPDYSATPFVGPASKERISKEIDEFNAINKRITLQYNISYTDITPSTRLAASDPQLIANDGLHPSGMEYKKWAELLAPKIKKALQ